MRKKLLGEERVEWARIRLIARLTGTSGVGKNRKWKCLQQAKWQWVGTLGDRAREIFFELNVRTNDDKLRQVMTSDDEG
jgi:hypothetical protein